jgi:S1-C subfamily serine protease
MCRFGSPVHVIVVQWMTILGLVVSFGCQHQLRPKMQDAVSVTLAPGLDRVGTIEVEQVPKDLFRGFTLATVPTLGPDFRRDVAEFVRSAIRRSGGQTDVSGAPKLRLSFEKCSMDWRVTGVITSVVEISIRGDLIDDLGSSAVFRGESSDTYTAFSVDVSINAERQFNKALQEAVRRLLSDRTSTDFSNPYAIEVRAFRRTLHDLGDSFGQPGYGVGLGSQSNIIAFPSPNALAAGLQIGDIVTEFGGVAAGIALTRQQAVQIEASAAQGATPLKLVVERDGRSQSVECPLSGDDWRSRWLSAIDREDWREALRIMDVATQGTRTCVSMLNALQVRRSLILLLDLRDDGNIGFDTLYASVAVIQELLDRAALAPEAVRVNRTFILQSIDLSRRLGSNSVADDMERRLTAFDKAQEMSGNTTNGRAVQPDPQVDFRTGTGFMVSSDGAILTARHVVENAQRIEVVDPDGVIFEARLVGELPDLDLALLEIDAHDRAFLPVAATLQAVAGDAVFTMGFPASALLGTTPKFCDGVISSISGLRGDLARMQVTVPVQPGNSGGPLVNALGEAVGVVVSSVSVGAFYRETGSLPQNVNFAVRADLARDLLQKRAATLTPPCKSREEAIDRARSALYRIRTR